LPLSRGRVLGEHLQCGYHGAQFDADGRCRLVPGQNEIPDNATVRSFPTRERHGFIWIWMGDAEFATLSEPTPITSFLDRGNWGTEDAYIHIACNYELINDNLADITHTEFVHPTTLGSESMRAARGETAPAPSGIPRFESNLVDGGMDFRLSLTGTRPSPSFANAYRRVRGVGTGVALNFQLDFSFRAPAFWVFSPTVMQSGAPAAEGVGSSGLILITPEDRTSSHYFHKICQSYAPESQAETRYWLEETCRAFDEDKVVLEAQQRNMDSGDGDIVAQVSFRGDWMGFQVRKLVRAMLAAENERPGMRESGGQR
jgi:vanillate O-demethylase monooxygenase subunit